MNEHLKRSKKQEKRGAKLYGGSVNAGSGNKSRKNDVRTDDWSIEFKTTNAASYSLRRADLELAERHAILEHRNALFGIDFAGRAGTSRYVVLTEGDLHRVLYEIEELRLELGAANDDLFHLRAERDLWSSTSDS